MKLTLLKPAIYFVLAVAGYFSIATSHAAAYFSGEFRNPDDERYYITSNVTFKKNQLDSINELNSRYFGNAGEPYGFNSGPYYAIFPGRDKRNGVFKLEKSSNNLKDGPRQDLVFDSKPEAENFCTHLIQMAQLKSDQPSTKSIFVTHLGVRKIISVAYKIAYNTGHSQKAVFCKHPWEKSGWNLEPSKYSDEDESKGIRVSKLRDTFYDVTCMDPNFVATTFEKIGQNATQSEWRNAANFGLIYTVNSVNPTEQLLNEKVGAKYCPVS